MRERPVHRLSLVAALLVGALTVASCSMVNPYLSHPYPSHPRDKSLRKTGDLEAAVSYAHSVKANYRKALGRETMFTSVLGALLIPTGAMALTMGIAGVHSNTILMTGGSGTALFGVGKWLESKPRQAAYVAGYNAVNCAIEAVLPFRFSDKHLTPFKDSMKGIDAHIKAVQNAIREAEKAKNAFSPRPGDNGDQQLLELAKDRIEVAKSLVASAKDARDKGLVVQRQRAQAGHALDTTVDNIIIQVDAAIQKSQLDLGALSAVISGLSQTYSQFTMVPDHLEPQVADTMPLKSNALETAPERVRLESTIAKLEIDVDKPDKDVDKPDKDVDRPDKDVDKPNKDINGLLKDKQKISKIVNLLTPEHSLAALKKCGVDLENITAITLNPAGDVTFEQGEADHATRWISGGKKPFVVMMPKSIPGLHITQPVFGRTITVIAETSLRPGTYRIRVVDGNERTVYFNIKVERK